MHLYTQVLKLKHMLHFIVFESSGVQPVFRHSELNFTTVLFAQHL